MRRKGTPRAKQGREHVLAVKTDNRQAVDRNNIHMAQCVLKAVKALSDDLAAHGAATGTYEKDGATYVYQVSGEPGNWHASVHLEDVDAEAAPSAAAEVR